jgi:endonuclease G
MTNHHVLPSAEIAARTTVEFDYQRDRLGREVAFQAFKLDPATFFLNDKELDFALVAVSPDGPGRALDDYMWCPLLKEPGKIITGEPINIIEHPKGDRKQVVIRENRRCARGGRAVLPLRGGHRAWVLRIPGVQRSVGGSCPPP